MEMVEDNYRGRISVAAKRYQESLRKGNAGAGKRKKGRKGNHPFAYRKQTANWQKCKFNRCRSPHKESKWKGYCSPNCQKKRTITHSHGFQFDLNHPVRSKWEREYALYLRRIGYIFSEDYKSWEKDGKPPIKLYFYEPKLFVLRGGLRYLPDFYLADIDTWIEVKGYMTTKDKEKIRKFTAEKGKLAIVDSRFFKGRYFKEMKG
jgi:hypothetical protein